jgi:hypothetical protein
MSNKKKKVELGVRAWIVAKSFLYFYTKFFFIKFDMPFKYFYKFLFLF